MSSKQSLFCDLHMHSCLSPCGSDEMTPNNLVNMAYLKGLDMIAVSDHNSAKNLPAIATICEARNILHVPAIEVETKEEVHVVCYFPTVSAALSFSDMLNEHLPNLPWSTEIFGNQLIMNDDDEITGNEKKFLAQASTLKIEDVFSLCRDIGGVPVPAHINRESNSIIFMLGFIPPKLSVHTVEVSKLAPPPMGVDLSKLTVLHSSDAHCLENIYERNNEIMLEEKSVACFLSLIRG